MIDHYTTYITCVTWSFWILWLLPMRWLAVLVDFCYWNKTCLNQFVLSKLTFYFYRQTQLQQTHHPANMACDTWSWQKRKKKKRKKETSSNISSRNKLLLGRSEGASAHLSARTRLGPHQTPTMAASRQQSQRWPGPVWVVVASVVVVVVVLVGSVDGARDHYEGKTVHRRRLLVDGQLQRSHHPLSQAPRWQRSDRPNIIMIMTDDQDLLLGMGCVCDVVVTITTTTPPPPPSTTTVKLMVGGEGGGVLLESLVCLSVCPLWLGLESECLQRKCFGI